MDLDLSLTIWPLAFYFIGVPGHGARVRSSGSERQESLHAEDDEVHDDDGDIQKLLGELEYIQEG